MIKLKNMTNTWLQITVGGETKTILSGRIAGPFEIDDLGADAMARIKFGDLLVIANAAPPEEPVATEPEALPEKTKAKTKRGAWRQPARSDDTDDDKNESTE